MTSLPPVAEYPLEPFHWCLHTVQIWWFSSFSVTEDICNFKLVILLTLSSSKLTLFNISSTFFGQATYILLSLGKTYHKKHRIWHRSFSMIQSAGIKNWSPQSINRHQSFSLIFLHVTSFSDFCNKIKYDKNKDKNFYRNGKISFKWLLFWQYCQKQYLEPHQKSMVELFWKNSKWLLAVNCFCKKHHHKC